MADVATFAPTCPHLFLLSLRAQEEKKRAAEERLKQLKDAERRREEEKLTPESASCSVSALVVSACVCGLDGCVVLCMRRARRPLS